MGSCVRFAGASAPASLGQPGSASELSSLALPLLPWLLLYCLFKDSW